MYSALVSISALIASLSLLFSWDNSQATAGLVRSSQSSSLYADASSSLQDGNYACNLTQEGYQYPDFACIVFTQADDTRRLEKLTGSQRFRGTVTPNADGFTFSGEYFCPYGDCTEAVQAEFEPISSGGVSRDVEHLYRRHYRYPAVHTRFINAARR